MRSAARASAVVSGVPVSAVTFAALLGCSGCGTYWRARWHDLRDVPAAYAGVEAVMPILNPGVEITPLLPIGFGVTTSPCCMFGPSEAYGMIGRRTGRFEVSNFDFPFNYLMLDAAEPFFLGGALLPTDTEEPETPRVNQRRWGRVGFHFGFVMWHVGAHLELLELADFLAGFALLDPLADDDGPPP